MGNRRKKAADPYGRRIRMTRKTRRRQLICRTLFAGCMIVVVVFGVPSLYRKVEGVFREKNVVVQQEAADIDWTGAPEIDVELLDVNEYSRPGLPLEKVNGIVIHYTANPGSSARANRDYFQGLKDAHLTKASSHFVVGLEGEVVQCIPTTEIAYASNSRNSDTIAIECCHPDDSGQFQPATYQSVVQLTAWLCKRFGLNSADVIRHYDVTGKLCPKYFVEHEDAWAQFRTDVDARIAELQTL